jgi:uncharacterized UBP type Zn finger protein
MAEDNSVEATIIIISVINIIVRNGNFTLAGHLIIFLSTSKKKRWIWV